MATKNPLAIPPLGTQRRLQAPITTVNGGITGQKMQPITRGTGGSQSGGDNKSNGGGSK